MTFDPSTATETGIAAALHAHDLSDPGFRHIKTEVLPMNKELAEKIQAMKASPTEREVNPKRLTYLRGKIKQGLFLPPSWIIAYYLGVAYRMNGQHTSGLVVEANGHLPADLPAVVSTYEVDSMEAMALLFRQIDARQSGRSSADVAGAYQGLHPDLQEVTRRIAKLACEGYVWYLGAVEGLKPIPKGDDRYALQEDPAVRDFIRWLDSIMSSKTKELMVIPVVAAMYSCYAANEAAATTFWREVAKGNFDDASTDPAEALSNWLMAISDGDTDKPKTAQFYAGCVFCWNQQRADRSVSSVKSTVGRAGLSPAAE